MIVKALPSLLLLLSVPMCVSFVCNHLWLSISLQFNQFFFRLLCRFWVLSTSAGGEPTSLHFQVHALESLTSDELSCLVDGTSEMPEVYTALSSPNSQSSTFILSSSGWINQSSGFSHWSHPFNFLAGSCSRNCPQTAGINGKRLVFTLFVVFSNLNSLLSATSVREWTFRDTLWSYKLLLCRGSCHKAKSS